MSLELTERDLRERKPVWIAFSNLFLDTDVSSSYDFIVRVCSQSPYTLDELKEILSDEVAPVVSVNLMSVAGEWAGFDEAWLVDSIQTKIKRRSTFRKKMMKLLQRIGFFKGHMNEHWEILSPKIHDLREKA